MASLSAPSPPGRELTLWLLTADLTSEQEPLVARAAENVRLHHHRLGPAELSLPVRSDYISAATFGRLYMGEILPASCLRALYLDADILVTADPGDLWQPDPAGPLARAAARPDAP